MAIFKKKDALDQELEELYDRARHIVQTTKNYDEAAIKLMEQEKVNEHYARNIIDNLFVKDENKANFKKSIIIGSIAMIASVAIAVLSAVASAQNGGGATIFFYGILAFGILTILRAFILYK